MKKIGKKQQTLELKLKELELAEEHHGLLSTTQIELSYEQVMKDKVFTSGLLHDVAEAYFDCTTKDDKSKSIDLILKYEGAGSKSRGFRHFEDDVVKTYKDVIEEITARPEPERLVLFEMFSKVFKIDYGWDSWDCDSHYKRPAIKCFGIKKYEQVPLGMRPSSRMPSERTIRQVMLDVCAQYDKEFEQKLTEESALEKKTEDARQKVIQLKKIVDFEKRGIDTDLLAQLHPELYARIDELPEEIYLDKTSGVVVLISDHHWYESLDSYRYRIRDAGGIGMERVVTIFGKDKKSATASYVFRDQYDPKKDDRSCFLRKVTDLKMQGDSITVEFETPVGARTKRYELK